MPYGIQQPAISGQLSQLEKTLGTKLFHRRPFGLTPGGSKLFAEIEPFFVGLADLQERVRGHATQRLRLAAPEIILRNYLPKLIADYKRRFPDFRLILHDANQTMAEELLRKREIDLAITELEGRPAGFVNSHVLMRLPLVLVAPKQSGIRSAEELFRQGKPSQSLISLPADEVIPKHFQAGLSQVRVAWDTTIEVSSLEMVDVYTSLGLGVGLSAAIPGLGRRTGLQALTLKKFPRLTIAALWSGDLSGPAAAFLTEINKLAARFDRRSIG